MLKSGPVNVNVDAMRKSIATVCLSGTLPDKLEAIAAARFDAVEIFENDLISFNGTPRDLASMTADLGLDSFHILSLGDDPTGIADIPGERIFFLQLADAPRLAMDVLQWSRHYRCFPGQGQLDLTRFLEQVLLAGYSGPLSLEIFNDVFREAPNRRTAIDAMQSLLFLESQTRTRFEHAAPGEAKAAERARVLQRVELFDPPAAPTIEGIAFVEFAVDETAATALAGVLETLGFRRAGRHRSKNVTLYDQGDIHLVLNAEPDSFASAHFADHGPSICALSLDTDDGVRALNRATALHCPRFDGRIGPHELRIPA